MARERQRRGGAPRWEFYTFPVFFAFMAGVFVAGTLISFEGGGVAGVVHLALNFLGTLGVSFGVVHLVRGQLARRREERERERAEEDARERRVLAAREAAASEEGQPPRRHRRRRG